MLRKLFILCSAFCFLLSTVYALDLPTFKGQEVLVIGKRLPTILDPLSRIPANITVITADDIEKSGTTNLPELLNRHEGIIVTDALGFGLEARVDLRGFGGEAKNTLVLLDGVRLSEPYDNSIFWKLISINDIEKVEIIRGGASSTYGEGALAGIINIITKSGTGKPKIETDISLGDYGQQKGRLVISGENPKIKYYFGGTYEKLDGYRQNSEHAGSSALTKISYKLGHNSNINFSINQHNDTTGTAGGITSATRNADPKLKGETTQDTDGYENKINVYALDFDGKINNSANLVVNVFLRSRLTNSNFWGTPYKDIADSYGTTGQLSLQSSLMNLSLGLETNKSQNNLEFSGGKVDRNNVGLFLQDDISFSKRINLILGLRYDKNDYDIANTFTSVVSTRRISGFSPKLGVTFNPLEGSVLFGALSQSFKAPEANVLISPAPNLFSSTPDIEPSKATNLEIGIRKDLGLAKLKANYYIAKTDNEILLNAYDGSFFGSNQNFNTMRNGLELSSELPLFQNAGLLLTYSNNEARFIGGNFADKTIPQVPRNKITASLDLKVTQVLNLIIDGIRITDQFILNDFNNIYPAENYTVVNTAINFKRESSTAVLSIKNLFNERYSPFTVVNSAGTIRYNPAPERNYSVGVSYNI